jgi:hypothetical protein
MTATVPTIIEIMKKSIFPLALLAGLFLAAACNKTPVDPNNNNNNNGNTTTKIVGTLEIEFRVPTSFLPPSRVLRADLSIAKDAESLYKGRFLQTANVYNSTLNYRFSLEPGTYYYQAGIICVAQGDSCSAAGFPGGQFGMKWAIGTAQVKENEITHVIPQFTR